MSKCVITGCRAVIAAEGKSLWGDLFQLHDGTWVLSGVLNRAGETVWEYVPDVDGDSNERQLLVTGPYFEKRGVVVVPATSGEYNQAAKDYLS
jgi:hypothetical protein